MKINENTAITPQPNHHSQTPLKINIDKSKSKKKQFKSNADKDR